MSLNLPALTAGPQYGNRFFLSPSSTTPMAERLRESIPTACLPCRTKHLKCDGAHPCQRCSDSGSTCAYVRSRRGYRGPRRASTKRDPSSSSLAVTPSEAGSDQMSLGGSYFPPSVDNTRRNSPAGSTSSERIASSSPNSRAYALPSLSSNSDGLLGPDRMASVHRGGGAALPSLAERCLDAFYQYFHGAHPFVVPRPFLHQIAHASRLEPLMAAMRWVGSLYIDIGPGRQSLLDEACHHAFSPSTPRDVFLLQAMMVLFVGLDGSNDAEKAGTTLREAESLAMELALNTRPFALLHGQGIPVLEESFRRTWWELLVLSGLHAGARRRISFALLDVPTDVGLPCEETEFLSGEIPPPRYPDELDERHFTNDEREFSSFAYRILAVRGLGRYLRAVPISKASPEEISRLEGILTDWRLNLPVSKRTSTNRDGDVDEMMFQAFMINYSTSLLVHQPFSQLDTEHPRGVTGCGPYPNPDFATDELSAPARTLNTHTRHTIASASAISDLVTHRAPIISHSPYFCCAVVSSSTVLLAKWALPFVQYDDEDLRRQLRLNIGALEELSTVWAVAVQVKDQVQGAARELYQAKKAAQAPPQLWPGFTSEQAEGLMTGNPHEWTFGEIVVQQEHNDNGRRDSDDNGGPSGQYSTHRS